jgi:hypothetical protein
VKNERERTIKGFGYDRVQREIVGLELEISVQSAVCGEPRIHIQKSFTV